MSLNLHLPDADVSLKPTITVIGVGGAGGNAVNNMISSDLSGVDFVVANTDAQALDHSLSPKKVQLGGMVTQGLGAGANPQVGAAAADEVAEDIARHIDGSNMVFITAGMGGGTGTGAAPVIAKIAREQGVLTVAVVTKPFQFEGTHRMRLADAGLDELQKHVDTLIIIPNQNLFRIANERTTFADAFKMADEVLHSGVRGVTDLMVKPGLINLDFADIRAVMQEMGKAMMGTGEASGERRAIEAAEAAISNPLLDDVSLQGARSLLINITGGMDMTLFEVDEAANRIRQEVDPDANIIFGSAFNEDMEGVMRVSVVATGIDANQQALEFDKQQKMNQAAPQPATDVQKKKPYSFTPQIKREPVKINPRTAQDIMPEAPKATSFTAATQAVTAKPAKPENTQVKPEDTDDAALAMARDILGEAHQAEPKDASKDKQHTQAKPQPQVSVTQNPVARPIVARAAEAGPAEMNQMADDLFAEQADAGSEFAISPRESAAPRDVPNTRGLFQRIADVSKVLSARDDGDEVQNEEPATPVARTQVKEHKREQVKKDTASQSDEDYIDIPAFLRRAQ